MTKKEFLEKYPGYDAQNPTYKFDTEHITKPCTCGRCPGGIKKSTYQEVSNFLEGRDPVSMLLKMIAKGNEENGHGPTNVYHI